MTELPSILVTLGAVASAIFTGWAIYQRWRYQPKPLWIAEMDLALRTQVIDGQAGIPFRITNRGNGEAFDTSFFVGRAGLPNQTQEHRAKVTNGECFETRFTYEVEGFNEDVVDERTGSYPRNTSIRFNASANLIGVTWRQPPRMEKVRSKSFSLDSLQPPETRRTEKRQ